MNDKTVRLAKVVKEIEECAECKVSGIGRSVPGEGSVDAQVVFVGEAPGKQESLSGRPFIGRSGKFLRKMITSVGLKESEVYITSPVKYLPTTGTPTPVMVKHGVTHLQKQLEVIQPKLVVLMGRVAAESIFGAPISVVKDHGTVRKKEGEPDRTYFITVHPAAAIRFGTMKKTFEQDFELLKTIVERLYE